MTALMGERFTRYSGDDIRKIVHDEMLTGDDMTFLTAISNFATVIEVPGAKEGKLLGMSSVDIPVFQVSTVPSGIYKEVGSQTIILINEDSSILDYDFISELHPVHDYEVYLWLDMPWSNVDESLGIHGEWYRRDVYPDGMTAFNGELGWEDLAPASEEIE